MRRLLLSIITITGMALCQVASVRGPGHLRGAATVGATGFIPAPYVDLYSQLSGQIATFQSNVNTACSGCATFPVRYIGEVTNANANAGWAVLAPASLALIESQIDGLAALGFTGVAIQAGFPLLLPNSSPTPWYTVTSVSLGGTTGQYQCPGDNTAGSTGTGGGSATAKLADYTTFYSNIASYARTNYGMKIIVTEEVQDSAAQVSGPHSYANCLTHWYPTLSLSQLNAARSSASIAVAQAMLPDYFAIAEEPDTEAGATGLPINLIANNAAMVNAVIAAVRLANPNPGMKISAGFGNFQTNIASYINAYTNHTCGGNCVTPAMDYLDIHFFLVLTSSFSCPSCNYQTQAFSIIQNAALMPVAISQAWAHKERNSEWGNPSTNNPAIEAREIYSFWDLGIDVPFWKLLVSFSNYGKCLYTTPFDTYQLYGYVGWSTATAITGEGGSLSAAQALALEPPVSNAARVAGKLSNTGLAVRLTTLGH